MALRVTPLRQQPVEQEPERKDREAVSLGFPEMVVTTRVAFFIPVLHGKQIHFPKLHASVCGIGITRPPHLLGRRRCPGPLSGFAASIMLTNCLCSRVQPGFALTQLCWECERLPKGSQSQSKLGWEAVRPGLAQTSGSLDEGRVERGLVLFPRVGGGLSQREASKSAHHPFRRHRTAS